MNAAANDTIFGKILRKEIPAIVVFEDDQVLAFRDVSPQAPTHILIIPKRPIATLNDAQNSDKELLGHLILTAQKIAQNEGIASDGYRLVLNCNENGGQSVSHIHFHLLGGRKLSWPPG